MNMDMMTSANAFTSSVSTDRMQELAPAVFAPGPHARTSSAYTFISTERVLDGLRQAGFVAVDVRQAVRCRSPLHARHMIRLRRRYETVQLKDSIPELVFLNSHDGTSAYQLRVGLYRVVCTNGLIVSAEAFPVFRVAHRGDVVADVVEAALEIGERFGAVAEQVERMQKEVLSPDQQVAFAARALALRYDDVVEARMQPSQLLTVRREEDIGNDVWRVMNTVQGNLLGGGLTRRSAHGRLTRTRRISAIREDVRVNSGLWDLALGAVAA